MSNAKDAMQVLVAYDFSIVADGTIDRAINVALRAPQHLIHFLCVLDPKKGVGLHPDRKVDYTYAEEIQEELKAAVERRLNEMSPGSEVHFFVHTRIGNPASEILEAAELLGVDLIFIGSHGRTGLKRLMLGSVSEKVVREAGCPVMVVRDKTYENVVLEEVVHVDPGQRDQGTYIPPHRYSYRGNALKRQKSDFGTLI